MCIQVSSHAIDEIGQLHHVEDENIVKWSVTSNDNVWNLVTFTDKHNASKFIRTVENVSKISLQIVRTQTSKTVQYSSVEAELIFPEEEKVPLSSQASAPLESFTTPPLNKPVFEDNSLVEPTSRNYINEAVDSDVDDTYSDTVLPKPSTDNLDDVIPLSPAHTIDDGRLRSSTPTNKVSNSAFVPGIEFNVKQKKLPKKLPSLVDVQVNNMCMLCTHVYMCVVIILLRMFCQHRTVQLLHH